MPGQFVKIFNGNIIAPEGIANGGTLLVKNKKIIEVSKRDIEVPGAIEIDAKGMYISPGFIDLHVHGGGGHDFMDGTKEAFLNVAKLHAQYGTTAITPTTLSCSHEELVHILKTYEEVKTEETGGAQFLGLHLEGPYFAMNQRGAQDPRFIRNPDPTEYEAILAQFNSIVRWSAAPELDGALKFGRYLQSKNILPALAHTDAIFEDIITGFINGYTHATHLYSGMNGVVRRGPKRYAGAVEAAFLIDDMTVEIIADGIHLPPPLLKLVYKIKGPYKTALITDAMRGAGMPEGESILGGKQNGLPVIIEDGVAKLPDRSAYAGSVATANTLIQNMTQLAEIPLQDAVAMLSTTPAAIMGLSTKGALAAGKDADVVLFDNNIKVHMTMVEGNIVFNNN
ncbi:MAG TPA: N-acetylglucosamine-6-phosphate deacetylase [Chitinophagaceae bacterium]|nr:N-acetylglucosamine-6-phosphate deacetylase [Chitinophagaceae bacterium]